MKRLHLAGLASVSTDTNVLNTSIEFGLSQAKEVQAAFIYPPLRNLVPKSNIGAYSRICTYCNAKKWNDETDTICCLKGQVDIAPLPQLPKLFTGLLYGYEDIAVFGLYSILQ